MAPALDAELAELVLDQSRQRLARLAAGLQALRSGLAPHAAGEVLDELVREAHTMKGSAAMVGLQPVSVVARAIEDRLRAIADGSAEPAPPLLDRLMDAVGALGAMVPAAIAGDDVGAAAARVVIAVAGDDGQAAR